MSNQFNPQNNQQGAPSRPAPVYPPPVSFKEWMISLLLMAIPVVGIIMLFVWAFSGSTNPSKANYAKAGLLWAAIVIVIYIIMAVALLPAILSSLNSSSYY
ncbi:heme/copper-type cytochrome/quinol oxidase subunit 2 [Paenibacillus polymyxa]|uniref:hypothetical protein n=1 Tax=Paenibacillus polymyxa TaxID=1406 RepID=UPI002794EA72|nr:hypothetical protein [Paenibacillus polymyxa]MDQ0045871.1 heme/copper-type cytochrome/quinol oxidase subunit 2 [Paenibacillus polymyxa]